MNLRVPLSVKLMVPVTALISIAIAASGYRIYQLANDGLQRELDVRLQRAANLIAEQVDTDLLLTVHDPSDNNSEAFETIDEQLDLARTAGGLSWIGIYYRDGDYLYYWVDADAVGVGYPFFYATPEHRAVFDDGQPRPVSYADEFGSYYGFVSPLVVEGEVIGIVEVSVQQETRQIIQREAWAGVLPILLGGIVVAVAMSLAVTHFAVNRPMRQLSEGATILAAGQFGHQIVPPSNDELGDLAETFNQMSTQIERLYLERVRDERARREREIIQLRESERILEVKVAERTAELARKNQELLASQEEVAAARDQALEASSAKSAFLARMSHELRTPLSVIVGYVDILKMKAETDGSTDTLEELDQIQNAARHILLLVNELLDMSKIEAGKMELYLEDVDVRSLLYDVAATVEPLVRRNENRLTVECEKTVGQMYADPTKIRQSLLNLLSNASKFTDNGHIVLRARRLASANGDADWITLEVSDTGVGIPPDKIDHLFEEYTQVHGNAPRGGTGLGLAITRRFCELMGGAVTVHSRPGQGATFTMRLPVTVKPQHSSQPL